MPANNWNIWWQTNANKSPDEREEFFRGVLAESKPVNKKDIIFSIIAGYVGGRIAGRNGKK